jgi:drug/metabolite transporter (DMT)-like permease
VKPGYYGIALAAAGIALLCGMDVVAKALGAHLGTFQIVFARFLGAALWLGLWIILSRSAWPRRADMPRQAMRALLQVCTASMFFYAVGRLPIALVTALSMTAPLYVTLLGALIFSERMSPRAWVALALGATGSATIILTGGNFTLSGSGGEPLALMAALLAPISYATLLVLLKHHSGTENPEAMTLGQSLLAAALVLPFAMTGLPEITAPTAGLLVLIGLLGALGFMLLVHGLKRMPVSAFAVLDYSALVWAGVFGFVFFRELPGPQLWVGGALIVAACVISARNAKETSPA